MNNEEKALVYDYETEESASMYIPVLMTIGMLAGLVIGELIFSHIAAGMSIGMFFGAVSGTGIFVHKIRNRNV